MRVKSVCVETEERAFVKKEQERKPSSSDVAQTNPPTVVRIAYRRKALRRFVRYDFIL